MKALVTGASGQLGSTVAAQLVEQGHEVVALDRAEGSVAGVHVHGVDLSSADLGPYLHGCSGVIHLAAIPAPGDVPALDLVRNNVLSTFNVLQSAFDAGVRAAVIASSGSIYGTAWAPEPFPAPYAPVDEDMPLLYVDEYAFGKHADEAAGALFARRGMSIAALQFHWIVSDDVLAQIQPPCDPTDHIRGLWGYVHLDDAAAACLAALRACADERDFGFAPLVIAAADTLVDEPTEQLLARVAPQTQVRHAMPGVTSAYDCSAAATLIGWRPRRSWRATDHESE